MPENYCDNCEYLMLAFGEGYYCNNGHYEPQQAQTTPRYIFPGNDPYGLGFEKVKVHVIRPSFVECDFILPSRRQQTEGA